MLVTTSRDKRLRIWDVRQERPVQETAGHSGAKNSRAVWLGEHDRIATTGFSKMSDRQLALWDIRAPREPISGFKSLDSISGVCMPFWDEGTQCLYLAGKGYVPFFLFSSCYIIHITFSDIPSVTGISDTLNLKMTSSSIFPSISLVTLSEELHSCRSVV